MTFSDEDFLRAIYHAVLRREPDPVGFAAHTDLLRAADAAEPDRALAATLRHFLNSEEFRTKFAANEALGQVRAPAQRAGAGSFAHAASLGSHCYTSWLLKQEGLKRYSLPFDWLFSSLPMAIHCIEDDFRTFLDPAWYAPRPRANRPDPNDGICDHSFYKDRFGVELVFNHYDPTEADTHAYFARAVDRFRRLLDSPEPKLFLAISDEGRIGPEDFPHLADLLDRRTRNAKLLAVRVLAPSRDARIFGFSPLDTRGPHELLRYQPTSRLLGLQFDQPIDDFLMRRLLGTLDFDLAGEP